MFCEATVWHLYKVGHVAKSILADLLRAIKDILIVYVEVEAVLEAYEKLSLVEVGASEFWPGLHLVR